VASRALFYRDMPKIGLELQRIWLFAVRWSRKNVLLYKVVADSFKTSPRTLTVRRLVLQYATKKIVIGIRVVAKSSGPDMVALLKGR
jgi:hypothetical protein